MEIYGLPFHDVPGITRYSDLKDPDKARLMGRVLVERTANRDGPQSLSATTLVTLAHLVTGHDRYRSWVLDYVAAWMERAASNDGILPDNVSPDGTVGAGLGGRWYGGLYGWTWPHGFYNIAMAAVIAGTNALLLSGDSSYLELPRRLLDRIFAMGEERELVWDEMSLPHHWYDRWLAFGDDPARTFVVPHRFSDEGWFDYQPPVLAYPATVWAATGAKADWDRIEDLRSRSGYDWRQVLAFRAKDEGGHEAPWLRFLAGDNPGYPQRAMRAALALVQHRMHLMDADGVNLEALDDEDFAPERRRFAYDPKHHATGYNPITTESLLQLTTASPQRLYNSGLPISLITYVDPERGDRPGLPVDVAAVVEQVAEVPRQCSW